MEFKNQQNRKRNQIQTSFLLRFRCQTKQHLPIGTRNQTGRKSNRGFIELETLIWLTSLSLITFATINLNQKIHQKNQKHIEEFNREWK